MSLADQDAFILSVNAWFSDPAELMGEGRPHKLAKNSVLDELGLHFRRLGRRIYLADEMSVLYPGEDTFVPDILAVLDVEQPADDEREAWVVERERRGLDLVLGVLHSGDRQKDLVRNVAWYARLGIPEYFVYDRRRQRLYGWRLPAVGGPYIPIPEQAGRRSSVVLGLDLIVIDDHLRFFQGEAQVGGTPQLIGRLTGMVEALAARAEAEEARADAATARAEGAEAAREAEVRAREAAEAARAETLLRAEAALQALRTAVLSLLAARGIEVPPGVAERVRTCDDSGVLSGWVAAAVTVARAEELP
jgi:Uma2 family endonuclease